MAIQDFKVKNGLVAAGNAEVQGGTITVGASGVSPSLVAADTTRTITVFGTSTNTITVGATGSTLTTPGSVTAQTQLTVGKSGTGASIVGGDTAAVANILATNTGTINLGGTGSTVAAQTITSGSSVVRGTTAATAVSLFDTSTGSITLGSTGSTVAGQTFTSATSTLRGTVPATAVNLFDTSTGTINIGGTGSTVSIKNLLVTGTTTTVNSSSLTVTDNLVRLGGVTSQTGLTGTSANGSNQITMTSTSGLAAGQTVIVTGGTLTLVANTTVAQVISPTVVQLSNNFGGTGTSVTFSVGLTGTGTTGTNVISGISSTATYLVGEVVTLVSAGTLTLAAGTTITAIGSTTLTLSNNFGGTGTNVAIVFSAGGPSDATASGGGLSLYGTTNKTIIWDQTNGNWTSSENINAATGKVYKINNTTVLSATQVLGKTIGGTSAGDIVSIDGTQTLTNKTISSGTVSGTITGSSTPTFTSMGSWSGTTGTFSGALSAASLSTGAGAIGGGAITGTSLSAGAGGVTAGSVTAASHYGQTATAGSIVIRANSTDTTGTISLNSGTIDSSALTSLFATPTTVTAFAAATTLTIGGSSSTQTVTIGGASTGASTYNFGTGSVASATKTINIGTNIGTGGTSNVNIGAGTGTTTINGTTQLTSGSTKVGTTTLTQGSATAYTITFPAATGTLALNNQTFYIGTTAIAINQASGAATLPNSALTNSTISGVSLGSNLATLTIGSGLSGTSYNGSTAVTIAASGLTTSNLSATAGITNGQLANSSVTIGTTAISLGGTATTIAGLTSISATTFTGSLSGNATTASETTAAFGRTDATAYPVAWIANNTNKSQLYSCAAVTITSSTGTLAATTFSGSGSGLTSIPASGVTGTAWTQTSLTNLNQLTNGPGYVVSGGALGTPSSGTLTNCTFPTLNQSTTGTARGLTRSDTAADTYNVQSWWDNTYWYLKGYNSTTYHAEVRVGVADKWTTARTFTIGSTGKSVNGSADVSWTLAEIGAAASNQTMYIGTTAVAINRTSAAQTLTGINIDGSSGSCSGNAATVSDGMYLTTAQTVSGNKTWTGTNNFYSSSGVGYTSQSGTLVAYGNTAATNAAVMSFHRPGSYAINMGLDTDNIFRLGGWSDGSNTYRWSADASGNFTARANITAYSDERLKANWRPVKVDLVSLLANVKSGVYDRIDNGETQVGVSAQSLREVMPEAVMESQDGLLSVAYGNAALVAVVELAKEIVELKKIIAELKAGK